MKHTIARSCTVLIGLCLVVYTGRLYFQGYHVVGTDNGPLNMFMLITSAGLGLYLMGCVLVSNVMLPTTRRGLLVLGVLVIFLAEMYLVDEPSRMMYLQDIMKLVGVFLVIAGPMKLLVTPGLQEKVAAQDIEIIEV